MKTFRFALTTGQWIELDGRPLRLLRRGRDLERRLVFEGLDGVPVDMTDGELLELQHGPESRLRFLRPDEVTAREEDTARPRVVLANDDATANQAAQRRLEYVRGWKRAGFPSRTEAGIADVVGRTFETRQLRGDTGAEVKPPSPRQVLRWISDWIAAGEDIEALVPQTATRGNCDDRLDPTARDLLDRVVNDRYLKETCPSAVSVHKHVICAFTEHNEPLPAPDRLPPPSLRSVYRTISRIDQYILDCTRKGRRVADHNWRPVMSAPQTTRHNEVWEIDHTLVDAIVVDGQSGLPIGRPWVTAAIDRHTRMITGFHIGFDPPGTFSTMECLRMAILPKDTLTRACNEFRGDWPCMGTPETIVPDQGKEFKARSFIEGLLTLGIDLQYAPILKAWYKGKIERFFRTLTTETFQRVPGTTFSNVFQRNKETPPERVAVVTLDELRAHTLHFVVNVYSRRRHRGLGVSPLEVWEESVRRHGMRPLPDRDRVTAALSQVAYRIPQRYGLEYEGLIYNSEELAACRMRTKGKVPLRVAVDAHDLTRLRFLDPSNNRFVEVPIQTSMLERVCGVSLEKHKLARALQRANPERLSEQDGLARAYVMLDDAMRAQGGASGLANRRSAARYWMNLTRAKEPEEAGAFDTEASSTGLIDGLFDEARLADRPSEEVTSNDEVIPDDATEPVPEAPAADASKARVRRTPSRRRDAPPIERRVAEILDDDADLEAFARARGMSVRKSPGGEVR